METADNGDEVHAVLNLVGMFAACRSASLEPLAMAFVDMIVLLD